jgi:hypothetical protein
MLRIIPLPSERRNALEYVLVEVGIARVSGDDAQNGYEPLKDCLISRSERLPCSDDDPHGSCSVDLADGKRIQRELTFHKIVILCDLLRGSCALNLR